MANTRKFSGGGVGGGGGNKCLRREAEEYWKAIGFPPELMAVGIDFMDSWIAEALERKWTRHQVSELKHRAKELELRSELYASLFTIRKEMDFQSNNDNAIPQMHGGLCDDIIKLREQIADIRDSSFDGMSDQKCKLGYIIIDEYNTEVVGNPQSGEKQAMSSMLVKKEKHLKKKKEVSQMTKHDIIDLSTQPLPCHREVHKRLPYPGGRPLDTNEIMAINSMFARHEDDLIVWQNKETFCEWSELLNFLSVKKMTADNVIAVYQNLLSERRSKEQVNYQKCLFSSPFLQGAIIQRSKKMEKFLKGIHDQSLAAAKYWFIPLNTNNHWHLLAINLHDRKIVHYDSGRAARHRKHAKDIANWAQSFLESSSVFTDDRLPSSWELIHDKLCPSQYNSLDCAIFLLKFEEYLQLSKSFDFSQNDMIYFRWKICAEILLDGSRKGVFQF